MSKEIVGWIISGLALLLMLLPVIWGMIRGKKRSAFRLIWVVTTGVLSIFIAMLVAKLVVELVKIQGMTLPEFALTQLENTNETLKQSMQDNPEVRLQILNLVSQIVMAVLKIVLFVFLFWGLKWGLYPVWIGIASKMFPKRAVSKKQIKTSDGLNVPRVEQQPQKKGILLGAVYGLLMGIFVLSLTFVPLSTLNNLVMAVETQTQTETERGVLSNILGENAQYLTSYQDSPVGKVLIATKVYDVQNFVGNELTTINFGGEQTSLTKEALEIAPLYSDVQKVMEYNFNDLTQAQINELVPIAKRLTTKVFDSKFLKSLYNTFRDYVIDSSLDTEKEFFVKLPTFEDAELNQAFRDCVAEVKNIQINDISNDILSAIDIVAELNKTEILIDLLKNNITFDVVRDNVSNEMVQNISEKLTNISVVNRFLPIALNPLAKQLCEKIPEVEYDANTYKITWNNVENVSSQALKENIDDIFEDLIYIIKNISKDVDEFEHDDCMIISIGEGENKTSYYVKYNVSSNIGGIVDDLRQSELISGDTYTDVMIYAETYAKKFVDGFITEAKYHDVVLAIDRMIDTLSLETSFRTEFGYLGNALKVYNNDGGQDIVAITKAIDEILPTFIYNHNIKDVENQDSEFVYQKLNSFLTTFANDLFSGVVTLNNTDIQTILAKIPSITSFEEEYGIISDLLDFVQNTEDLTTTTNLTLLGRNLDTVKTASKLIDDSTCKILLKNFINGSELPDLVEDETTKLTDEEKVGLTEQEIKDFEKDRRIALLRSMLLANIDSIESYEFELSKVANVLNTNFDTLVNLADYGAVMDTLYGSKLFNGIVSAIAKSQIKNNVIEGYEDIFDDIANNIENINNTFGVEFGYLDALVNFVNNSGANLDLSATKDFLEENLLDEDTKMSKSVLLDDETLYDLVVVLLDKVDLDGNNLDSFGTLKQDIISQLDDDVENQVSILTVVEQLDALKTYYESDLKDSIEIDITTSKADLEAFGAKIDALKGDEYSAILNNDAVNDIGKSVLDTLADNITDATQKANVEAKIAEQDWTQEINYQSLMGEIADELGIV